MIVQKYKTKTCKLPCYVYSVVSECHNCGQVFVGEVYCQSTEWSEISKAARTELSSCPICNKRFTFKEEFSVWAGKESNSTQLQKQLREKISQFESEEYRAAIGKQIAKIKSFADMPANNEIAGKIKSDISSLKAYIHQVIDLEIWARFLEEQIISIDVEKASVTKVKIRTNALEETAAKKKIETKEQRLLEEIKKLEKRFRSTDWAGEVESIELIAPIKPEYQEEEEPQKPVMPEMKTSNIFNKKKVLAENERMQKEYEKSLQVYEQKLKHWEETKNKNAILRQKHEEELKKYHENVEMEKARVKEESAIKQKEAKKQLDKQIEEINKKIEELKTPRERAAEDTYVEIVLKKEKDECLTSLKTVYEARNKLFSLNVIYPNYRDIFALSSFYEYFNSERCYELEGPSGAYNLYEAERRSDAFSTFFRKLEDINKNQVVLYRETSNMFKNLKSIVPLLKEATKVIVDKVNADAKISEKFVEESFEKYFMKNEKFKIEITKCVERALSYLK